MSSDEISSKNIVKFKSNRFLKSTSENKPQLTEVKKPYSSALCEDVDYSSGDSSSSSNEEIFLENYTTKRNQQLNINSSTQPDDVLPPKQCKPNYNNLRTIFERSDESSVSSQSTLVHEESDSSESISTNHFLDNSNEITHTSFVRLPMNGEQINHIESPTEPNSVSKINDSLCHNHNMHNDIATNTHTDLCDEDTQPSVYNWSAINNKQSALSQLESTFNKRTPRFHIKNNSNNNDSCEQISLINNNYNNDDNMQKTYPARKPDLPKKPTHEQLRKYHEKELITDLDDEQTGNDIAKQATEDDGSGEKSGSYFKNQMFKSYSKTDLKGNHRFEKRSEAKKLEIDNGRFTMHDKDSPSRRSQEITGSIMKMDKTIDRVTNNIVKIDNALDRMTIFNRGFMANLEKESDAELSSDFDTQSIGAQTESMTFVRPDIISRNFPIRRQHSSSTSESSTEKESTSEDDDDDSGSLKPSPVHQVVNNNNKPATIKPSTISEPRLPYRTVANLKSQHQDSDLSSLPESSVCDEPEARDLQNQVKYFQRQIKKSAGLYKKPPNVEPPKKLVVTENTKHRSNNTVAPPIPKPRNSIDGSMQGTLGRHYSTSSSESSSIHEYQRTLSNSNNRNQSGHSPVNSDSGSLLSFGSNNHFEKRFQKGGTGGRYVPKNNNTTSSKTKHKDEEEAASLSGKYDHSRSPMQRFLPQSRSYNSLHAFNSQLDNDRLRSGSLAALNNTDNPQDIEKLCNLIQQLLKLNNYDRIKSIFAAMIDDNDHDGIEDIIDHFQGRDRSVLLDIAAKAGYGLKEAESIFDMRMSRTDLNNNLRPGLSISTLSDMNYQNTLGTDKMVYWRPDIEELLPPPMKPLPKPMPTNLLKSAIISPESAQHVDNKVVEVLQFEPTTFTELVQFLTRDYSKDVEKVRALFRWITMYDMKHLNFDPAAPNDTLIGVLRAVKSGQMSYNELFFRMCRFAGIHCQFICGYSKGAGYKPGMTIKDNRMFRNVWTTVYVAGAWRFVNCNWGARYLTSYHHEPMLLGTLSSSAHNVQSIENRYRCDEFYFLTDPKQHIFEHFPDKKRWQLLSRPITLDQFMALPIVKSPFFNANLSFKRNYPETLQTKNGKVTVKINMPTAIGISCRLENRADNSILRGLTLVRVMDNQMIMVTTAPSQPGKFYLSIYVNDDWKSEEGREMACSFQVHCSEHNYDRLVTGRFPEVGVLGATPAAQNLGVVVNATVDPFVIWDERSAMKLNLVISPGLRIGHKMMSYDRSGQNSSPCDSYALFQSHGQGRQQYHLRFPIDAFYCLTIFAGVLDPHMPETEPMECIYRLLVDCRHAQERIPPFPRQTSRWVGFKLIEPLSQHLELNKVYRFRILSSVCSSIAVVINDANWYDLTISGDGLWKGKINTGQELDNLSVYGKFGSDSDDEFIKLLDYVLVPGVKK